MMNEKEKWSSPEVEVISISSETLGTGTSNQEADSSNS